MGQSSRLNQEISEELHIIEVTDVFYKENYELLKPPRTRHIRTIVINEKELFKNDSVHDKLLKSYLKASKDLNDYKFNKRHSHR